VALGERRESNGPTGVIVGAYFYILRLESGKLYPGATTNLDRRWSEHCAGTACRTTRLDRPTEVAYAEEHATFSDARQREAQVKRWSSGKKEALVAEDMRTLHDLARRHRR